MNIPDMFEDETSPTKRARVSRENARVALLDAAHVLFCKRGIDAVSVDDIVCKAGLQKVTLYRAFGSRQALVMEYVRIQCEAERCIWDAPASENISEDPQVQLVNLFGRLSEGAASGTIGQIQALHAQCAQRCDEVEILLRCQSRQLRCHLNALCTKLKTPNPHALSVALFSLWQGIALNAWTGAEIPSPAELERIVSNMLAHF
ncbi:TetR/AcrR family transcriptional regulator [Paraburkholderia sp. C35]|uniref:TetR/AcrR family transcriptional regulator n=1 Tax=Paraburkholderia sp. C35 TaxID=2126993 RepID=UPI001EF56E7C|nr:TetR/AcrR family transcriptional regulator [Paraburkholderia sp. C35]